MAERTATPFIRLAALSAFAVLVHGYHLGADDAAIYIPAIKHAADPTLYPMGEQFFMSHARLSLFPDMVGGSARLLHIPVDWAILACHALGIALLILAAWRLACACFQTSAARWGAVGFLAAMLTVPVAGTALVIADPYLTARALSTPAALFAVASYVSGRFKGTFAWLVFALLIHPQMFAYAAAFIGVLWLNGRGRSRAPALAAIAGLPVDFDFQPASGPAREALLSRTYFFVSRWAWYEWIGVAAPLAALWWFGSRQFRGAGAAFRPLARALLVFGIVFTVAGIALSSSPSLENFTRLQPMRAFHLIYAVFFVMIGGLVGEYVLSGNMLRWAALFVPLSLGMWALDRATYPSSPHIEWPGMVQTNSWAATFYWIRANTPKEAVFALDANYMKSAGNDMHGFRAIAERSVLADRVKDSGVVSLFPDLAPEWDREVRATAGWNAFSRAGYQQLVRNWGVSWIVTKTTPPGMSCPYTNGELMVCRLQTP